MDSLKSVWREVLACPQPRGGW